MNTSTKRKTRPSGVSLKEFNRCLRKVPFDTYIEARKEINRLKELSNQNEIERLVIYVCINCNKKHIGKEKEDES
jgi:hypothetical protein